MSESHELIARPPVWQVTATVFVISGSVAMFSLGLAGLIARFWDPCAIIGALFFCTLGFVTGTSQFVATFRALKNAATVVGAVLICLGILSIAAFVIGNIELTLSSGFDLEFFPFGLEILLFGTVCASTGSANLCWARRLRNQPAPNRKSMGVGRWNVKLWEFLVLVLILNGVFACTAAFVRSTHPRFAEHVDSKKVPHSLPRGATDASYCQGFRGTFLCEFSCSEAAFRDWVESGIGSIESRAAHVKLRSITGPTSILRYSAFAHHGTMDEALVNNGLVYEWHKEDRGVKAIYDRDSGRGYFSTHSH